MGLPKPLGKFTVAFGDFELRRIDDKRQSPESAPYAPPFRVFYPTDAKRPSSWRHRGSRAWLQDLRYTWGFCCNLIAPTTVFRRMILWIVASTIHALLWPWSSISASVGEPVLPPPAEDEESRLPVVIFSHGLWSCRTTYSALCCDLASHGYVVVAIEHLDGSAQMAKYVDYNGKDHWLPYSFARTAKGEVTIDDRAIQLNLRCKEVKEVVDVLESLDHGLLTQGSNTVTGSSKLEVTSLLHRLDLNCLAAAGHSFGGATALVVSGVDPRFKCCLGLDVWWEPLDSQKLLFDRATWKSPTILLNTENFNWEALRKVRSSFLLTRLGEGSTENALVTQMITIKGTVHEDQSDFPLVFKCLSKSLGFGGKLPAKVVKDVNSRACLAFLQQQLFPQGGSFPLPVELVSGDEEYLKIEDLQQT